MFRADGFVCTFVDVISGGGATTKPRMWSSLPVPGWTGREDSVNQEHCFTLIMKFQGSFNDKGTTKRKRVAARCL